MTRPAMRFRNTAIFFGRNIIAKRATPLPSRRTAIALLFQPGDLYSLRREGKKNPPTPRHPLFNE